MIGRRAFLSDVAGSAAFALFAVSSHARAQQPSGTTTPMSGDGYRPVPAPPRSAVSTKLTSAERDDAERRLKCACGTCTLDVYTCRTTDFSCPVSPAMHRDVLALVEGGHSADEIIAAFVGVYGGSVRMVPEARGFNLVGYLAPFVALTIGAVMLVTLLRSWSARSRARVAAGGGAAMPVPAVKSAANDELARLEAAIRDDG